MEHTSYLTTFVKQFQEMLISFGHFFDLKIMLAILLSVGEFLFGIDTYQSIFGLTVLIVIDLATGVFSTRETGEPISSRRIFKTAAKLGVYLMLISSAHVTENIIPGVTFVDQAMVSFLALTELVSIMENVGKMGYTVPQKLLGWLRKERDDK